MSHLGVLLCVMSPKSLDKAYFRVFMDSEHDYLEIGSKSLHDEAL